MVKLLLIGLLATSCVGTAYAQAAHYSVGETSPKQLLTEMAQLIRQNAFFHGGTAAFRYDARADTVSGLKLYVGEQVAVLGDRNDPDWYVVDFDKPIKPADFRIVKGRKDYFYIDAAKNVVMRVKNRKNRRLHILFFTYKNQLSTDLGPIHDRLAWIVSQLTTP